MSRDVDDWRHDQPVEFKLMIICYDTNYIAGPLDLTIRLVNLKPVPIFTNLPGSATVSETQTALITGLFIVSSSITLTNC